MRSKKVITQQGETVDALCWRHYGRTAGTVESVLEANAGLAERGVVLPMVISVTLPVLTGAERHKPLIQLFD